MPQTLKPQLGFHRAWDRQRAVSAPYCQAIIAAFDDIERRVSEGESVVQILAGIGCRWSHLIRVARENPVLSARLKAAQRAGKTAFNANRPKGIVRRNRALRDANMAKMRDTEPVFLEHVRAGNTIAKAAALAGVGYRTVTQWMNIDDGFRARFKVAQCRFVKRPKMNQDIAQSIIEAIEGGASARQAARQAGIVLTTFWEFLHRQPALWLRYDAAIAANRYRQDATINRRVSNDDMLRIIDRAIPAGLDPSARDDLRSQAVIAVLSGEARLTDIGDFVKKAMKAFVADEKQHAAINPEWLLDEMDEF